MKKKKTKKSLNHVGGITVYLGPELNERVERVKVEKGITKTFMVKAALTEWIETHSEDE